MSPAERRAQLKVAARRATVPAASVTAPLSVGPMEAVDDAVIFSGRSVESLDDTNPTRPGRPLYPPAKTSPFPATSKDVGTTPIDRGRAQSALLPTSPTSSHGIHDSMHVVCVTRRWSRAPRLPPQRAQRVVNTDNSGNGALSFTVDQALSASGGLEAGPPSWARGSIVSSA